MKFERCPVIKATELEKEINSKFNFDIDDIAVLLFDDDFVNDSYKKFYLDDEYEDQIAVIAEYLKDMFPYDKKVLIDVSW